MQAVHKRQEDERGCSGQAAEDITVRTGCTRGRGTLEELHFHPGPHRRFDIGSVGVGMVAVEGRA